MRAYEPFSNGAGGMAQRLTTVTCDWCGRELWKASGQPWRQAMLTEAGGRMEKFDLCPDHAQELLDYTRQRAVQNQDTKGEA